ncbi:MAG TPA: 4-(cytidine 5'-diphospho)-2-C-methyl-D-erythritol kinase [Candidatus Limnocylindrales bacterium]|jgi:4-diphosphocytidyl-2-C-methyl-D-erythritol kinase|nr:4-(cytidine 5'-diphospho)-2-C-methyl-D-erythritol kinase [Candidatus Limnocylindrales bacterium]
MALEKLSPCKVNLLLNILGKRPDGFHDLETVMYPVRIYDRLRFSIGGKGIQLKCNEPSLPTDSANLVYRAAASFLESAKIAEGVQLELEKSIPMAAGLGGGSANAATTLLGLNELFGSPLAPARLHELAASLGSDVPFFLHNKPALGTGRGEKIEPLEMFACLNGCALLLIYPGFGIATAWAYQQLARFPEALNGRAGRAKQLISLLQSSDLKTAASQFYNSLEAPAFWKFPLLVLFQEFLRTNGAIATLMSGSGSTSFALVQSQSAAETLAERFKVKFGDNNWIAVVPA